MENSIESLILNLRTAKTKGQLNTSKPLLLLIALSRCLKNEDRLELFDIYEDEKIGKDKKSYAVSFTFRDTQKTLQDTEIEQVMNKLIAAYQTELNALLR